MNDGDRSSGEVKVTIGADDLLLVVDVQNDFCPEGSLPVPRGNEVVPVINRLTPVFRRVVLTQDWHTPDHASFASQHDGKQPFETVAMPYGEQVLWPDHCVQGTKGADFHRHLNTVRAQLVLRKGFHREIDSYSAFYENDHATTTGLAGYLRERRIGRLFVCGLATDFCVLNSVLDGRREGFEVVVLEDACRGIDLDGSLARAWQRMEDSGAGRLLSSDLDLPKPEVPKRRKS